MKERMYDNIQIMDKPDWVSWDEIHDILWKAHERNRENGIFMRYPTLSGDEIRKRVEGNGKMLVAVLEGKIVGTSAVIYKEKSLWCGKGMYAYCCFDSVLPEMQGKGVYKQMCFNREEEARKLSVDRMLLDTNEKNQREINVVTRNGFKKVSMSDWRDHCNIVFVKWLNCCPYSDFRFKVEFCKSWLYVKMKQKIRSLFIRIK